MQARWVCLAAVLTLACAASALGSRPDWPSLHNPVLAYPDWSAKDYACAYQGGVFYLFFSAFYEDGGRVRSHVVEVTTRDFRTYSEPVFNVDGQEDGWIGLCSPNISKCGDTYYLTLNSWGDQEGKPNRLFYMSSEDLKTWSPRKPLAANLTGGKRAIDAAVAFANGKCYLFWKEDQITRCAVSESMDGEFRCISDGYPKFVGSDGVEHPWNENYQPIRIRGKWHMVTTTKNGIKGHIPHIYMMKGNGDSDSDWLIWVDGWEPVVQVESFNSRHESNASAVLDMTEVDGFVYLLYAGNTETKTYLGRGWNKLGLSRAKDLIRWLPAGSYDK